MEYPDIRKGLLCGCFAGLIACSFGFFTSIAFVETRISIHQTDEDRKQHSFYESFSLIKNLPSAFLMKQTAFVFFIIGVPVGIAAAFRPDTRDNKQKLEEAKEVLQKLEEEVRTE